MLSSEIDAARAWADSGGSWLTGERTGPPTMAGAGAGAVAEHLLREIEGMVGPAGLPTVAVLGERAALAGLARDGARSCGGASRLLPTADGHLVLTLARPDDLSMVPALVESPCPTRDPWVEVAAWARRSGTQEAADRLRLLSLPGGAVGAVHAPEPPVLHQDGGVRTVRERPRVLDLSSLWAGPLCAHLLGIAGADVVKVESATRYDGARRGDAAFYDLLHAGHRSVVLDFDDPVDRDRLQRLAASADVVIEGSRPHALARLGLDVQALVAAGVTWVSITAHGRGEPDRVGFGDDVAACAGLVGQVRQSPIFVGDAVADPLTGLAAAAAALRSLRGPRAQLLDVAMVRVAAWAASVPTPNDHGHQPSPPHARRPSGEAAAPGVDTDAVVREWLGEWPR